MIHQIVYTSAASAPLSQEDIDQILDSARSNNSAADITGMLLCTDEGLIQLLEGEQEQVLLTYELIKADSRHNGVLELLSRTVRSRMFPDWRMGYEYLAPSRQNDAVFRITRKSIARGIEGITDQDIRTLMQSFLRVSGTTRRFG